MPKKTKGKGRFEIHPTSEPVYSVKVPNTKSSKKNETTLRNYYDGAILGVPAKSYDADFRSEGDMALPESWKVHVGDVVAMRAKEAGPPTKKPKPTKQIWYPFVDPWSPAQIIAIFQDIKTITATPSKSVSPKRTGSSNRQRSDEFKCIIRWLYRPNELREADVEGVYEKLMKVDIPDEKYKNPVSYPKCVVETSAVQEYLLQHVLGMVLVTTYEKDIILGQYQDPITKIPRINYICNRRVDENEDVLLITDWDEYHANSSLLSSPMKTNPNKDNEIPAPLLRGLKHNEDKELVSVYRESFTSRVSSSNKQTEQLQKKKEQMKEAPVLTTPGSKMRDSEAAQHQSSENKKKKSRTVSSEENTGTSSHQPSSSVKELNKDTDNATTASRSRSKRSRANNTTKLEEINVKAAPEKLDLEAERISNDILDQASTEHCDTMGNDKGDGLEPFRIESFSETNNLKNELVNNTPAKKWIQTDENNITQDDDVIAATRSPFLSRALGPSFELRRVFLCFIDITPRWNCFDKDQLVSCSEDRKGLRWTLKVGDVVAIDARVAPDDISPCHPYSVPWDACQVLAIYRETKSEKDVQSGKYSNYMVEIRRFYREKDLPSDVKPLKKVQSRATELHLECLHETDIVEKEAIKSTALLGPLTLIGCDGNRKKQSNAASLNPSFMPAALLVYGGFCPETMSSNKKRHTDFSMHDIVKRGIEKSKHYTKFDQEELIKLLSEKRESSSSEVILTSKSLSKMNKGAEIDNENGKGTRKSSRVSRKRQCEAEKSRDEEDGEGHAKKYRETMDNFIEDDCGRSSVQNEILQQETRENVSNKDSTSYPGEDGQEEAELNEDRISTSREYLYHSDASSMRTYYTEATIRPPYKHYCEKQKDTDTKQEWTVKMGDIVAIHYEIGSGAIKNDNLPKHYPYKVPWAVGEIVTIWKNHGSKEEVLGVQKCSRKTSCPSSESSPVMIEVRWLYRQSEVPGFAGSAKTGTDDEYEEVLETDQLDECNATSLLAPASLHSAPTRKEDSLLEFHLGMPVAGFYCRRFFSIHRKSLLPFGTMEGMPERGRMYSKYLGRDQVLKAAWAKVNYKEISNLTSQSNISTEDAFREAIKKLSLTDASEDTNIRGLNLIGRKLENEKIMSFLRSAIIGSNNEDSPEDSHAKSSIFVAGPPGTGKTASVRSIVERLRREQAQGKIPEFEFVGLNGMEMRHPFDSYVKLWEAVSPSKEKRPPEVAASLLERHFSSEDTKQESKESQSKRPVTVLLLDEIDYLVTKKQTVLYNFFDWPRRTSQNKISPRLVVIGISNTLNLPERLKPSVQSRLGGARCDFQSYKKDEIITILKAKIKTENKAAPPVFDEDAIVFAANKTAAVSGDVRRALQLCKAAAEAVLTQIEKRTRSTGSRAGPIVRISDVMKVSRESASSMVLANAIKLCAPFEVLLIVSLASLMKTSVRRNQDGFDMKELMTKMESVAGGSGDMQYMPPPTFGETLDMLNRLAEARILSLRTPKSSLTTFRASLGGSGGAWPLVSLPIEENTIRFALRGTPHENLAAKYLQKSLF